MPRMLAKRSSSKELADLLQTLFGADLIAPSSRLWIISPWISDIPVLDNRDGAFLHLEPSWSPTFVKLSEVAGRLAAAGTRIVVACRPDPRNDDFLQNLENASYGCAHQPHVFRSDVLHEKGVLADSFYLSGSMNFTFHGLSVNEEVLQLHTDPKYVAEKRLHLSKRWPVDG